MGTRHNPSSAKKAALSVDAKPPGLLSWLFFFSGILALIYEVLWHRQFSLLFGSGAPATAAVLAAYFAGMGLGSFIFGKLVKRCSNALKLYAVLEISICAGVLLVEPVLSLYAAWYPELVANFGDRAGLLLSVKGILAFAAILLPTAAMGGTLPILAQWVDAEKQQFGRRVGWLYAMNAAGAALGALLFPFILLPQLGAELTNYLCAGSNFLIGALAFWIARRASVQPAVTSERIPNLRQGEAIPFNLVLLAFYSGTGTFALQVIWNRAFAQVHENTIFSFALIASMFILAIAAGAELARRLLRKKLSCQKILELSWISGGLLTLLTPWIFVGGSDGLAYLPSSSALFLNGRVALLLIAVIVIPVALLTCVMPVLFDEAARQSKRAAGEITGTLVTVNTFGSIAGALLGGFVLPKILGLWGSTSLVGAIFIALAIRANPLGKGRSAGIVALIAGLLLCLNWAPGRVSLDAAKGENLLAVKEGPHGIVAVIERAGSRRLKLNNHYLLGGTSSTGDERMQAHIPLTLGSEVRSCAFLGYGTGITAGGALLHPRVAATALELVPEVATFAAEYFKDQNLAFGTAANSQLIIEDARNFLRGSRAKFDVIIGDLVVPWRPGEAGLYTLEHFIAAKASLSARGIFCVWVPMFQIGETEFQILLRTFLSTFQRAFIWRGDFSPIAPSIALIGGRDEKWLLDAQTAARNLAEMKPDTFNPQLRFPAAFWMQFIGVVERGSAEKSEEMLNSEDRPWLELRSFARTAQPRAKHPFVGRELQKWQESVRQKSSEIIARDLSKEAAAGWEAGASMVEFTLALDEGNQAAAQKAQKQIEQTIGKAAHDAVFGQGSP